MASDTRASGQDEPRADDACAETPEAVSTDERVLALERERDEALASWQRAQADYQNLRRRMQSDIDAAVLRAKKPLLQDLLLVLDVLDMALATKCTTTEGQTLLAGVQMTRGQLAALLEREGIKPVPDGGTFDPAQHQSVEKVETDDHAPGTILATLRKGYTAQGQILRPAQVRVAVARASAEAPPAG